LPSDLKELAEDVSSSGIGRRRSEHYGAARGRQIPLGPRAALAFCGDESGQSLRGAVSDADLDAVRDPGSVSRSVAKEQLPSIEPILIGVAFEGTRDGIFNTRSG
jgi:hypothetical protein